MEVRNEIDRLAEAIAQQCGMSAAVTHSNHPPDNLHPEGWRGCQVQIRLRRTPENPSEDWLFFTTHHAEGLTSIRDRLVDFITEHRATKTEAA